MIDEFTITEELKLEVFKRDDFKCRICHRQVPKVVLRLDRIDSENPKKKGTEDELVTVCTECYHDHHNLTQPKPLEMMDERKAQMKQFIRWKESWSEFNNDSTEMVVEYIDAMIEPFSLNRRATQEIGKALKKYSIGQVICEAEIAFDKTIQFNENGNEITKSSAEKFINNIHKFLFVRSQDEITQRIYFIRGICRNRFHNQGYDCKDLLTTYVGKLRENGWDDERILEDLNEEVIKKVALGNNTSRQFESHLNKWIQDVQSWIDEKKAEQQKKIEQLRAKKRYTTEQIADILDRDIWFAKDKLIILCYLLKSYPYYTEEMGKTLWKDVAQMILDFVKYQKSEKERTGEYVVTDEEDEEVTSFIDSGLRFFYDDLYKEEMGDTYVETQKERLSSSARYFVAENVATRLLSDILNDFVFHRGNMDEESVMEAYRQTIAYFEKVVAKC